MWKRAILIAAVTVSTLSLAGCLVIPLDYYKDYSRKNVAEEPPEKIVAGTTTLEGVLLRLGEPDRASQDESELWYIASKVKGGVVAGYSSSEIVIHYVHAIVFDAHGFVDAVRLQKTDSIEKYELWSNEFGMRNFEMSYIPEPHFSNPPATLPVKKE